MEDKGPATPLLMMPSELRHKRKEGEERTGEPNKQALPSEQPMAFAPHPGAAKDQNAAKEKSRSGPATPTQEPEYLPELTPLPVRTPWPPRNA